MTVNFIVSYFFPQKAAGANRINSVIKSMLANGNDVRVFALSEPGELISSEQAVKYFGHKNLHVRFIPQVLMSISNIFVRMVYEVYYSIKIVLIARVFKADMTYVSIPYTMLLPATLLCSKRGLTIDVRDLIWLYNDYKKGKLINLYTKILENICIFSLARAETIFITNSYQADYIKSKLSKSKTLIIPNGISYDKFKELSNLNYPSSRNKEEYVVTYAGTVGFPQGLSVLLKALEQLEHSKIPLRVNIVGTGKEIKSLVKYVADKEVKFVSFTPPVDWKDLKEIYSSSNILFAHLRKSKSLDSAVPSKLYEYLSTGLPILFGGGKASVEALSEFENVYIFSQDNHKDLAQKIYAAYHQNSELTISTDNIAIIRNHYIREDILNTVTSIMKIGS